MKRTIGIVLLIGILGFGAWILWKEALPQTNLSQYQAIENSVDGDKSAKNVRYSESKSIESPNKTYAFFFRSVEDISQKNVTELCYNGSEATEYIIYAEDAYPQTDDHLVPVVRNVQTGEEKVLTSLGSQQAGFSCSRITQWIDGDTLEESVGNMGLPTLVKIDVEADIPIIVEESVDQAKIYANIVLSCEITCDNVDPQSIEFSTFDFDGDGETEYIVYYKEVLSPPAVFGVTKQDWNGIVRVYKKKGDTWGVVYEDMGTVGKKGYGVTNNLVSDTFLKIVDIDNDNKEDVVISSMQDGSGAYIDRYTLAWDGNGIVVTDGEKIFKQ